MHKVGVACQDVRTNYKIIIMNLITCIIPLTKCSYLATKVQGPVVTWPVLPSRSRTRWEHDSWIRHDNQISGYSGIFSSCPPADRLSVAHWGRTPSGRTGGTASEVGERFWGLHRWTPFWILLHGMGVADYGAWLNIIIFAHYFKISWGNVVETMKI